jgi:CubicO group peptidase (beta-lactamase class C family)
MLAAVALAAGCGGGSAPVAAPSATPSGATGGPLDLSQPWTTATPSDVGMTAGDLEAAANRAAAIPRARSLVVARHGRVVLERYFVGTNAATFFDVRSVTKSVVSALTGIAIEAKVLPSADVLVSRYLEPPYRLAAADASLSVRHLLTMTSGFQWNDDVDYNPWILSDDHVQYLLDRPQAHAPGVAFTYNSAAVHVLGVALERAAGVGLPRYADDHLFSALGAEGVGWEALDRGTVNGGSGIRLRSRDMLKLGQLYLQRGRSADRSVVPESWVDETTRPGFTWRETYGAQREVTYGMLWWVSDAAPASFFAWGYGGQFIYVVPSLDLVVVTTTEWRGLAGSEPLTLAESLLGVIVENVVPAAH